MPAPLANRFLHFEVEADLASFRRWALGRGLHDQILSFVAFRPELLHHLDSDHSAWPSPRTWEMASELHAIGCPITSAVGQATGLEFESFLQVYDDLPDLEVILRGKRMSWYFPVNCLSVMRSHWPWLLKLLSQKRFATLSHGW